MLFKERRLRRRAEREAQAKRVENQELTEVLALPPYPADSFDANHPELQVTPENDSGAYVYDGPAPDSEQGLSAGADARKQSTDRVLKIAERSLGSVPRVQKTVTVERGFDEDFPAE